MLGCDENKPTAETYDNLILKSDQTVTLKGKASMEPYIKENQSALIFDGKPIFFQGDFKSINEDINGQSITVTGKLIKKRWPMFIYDPSTHKGPVPQGMPMPPGTDIEKESLYFVIESPHWKVN